MRGPENLWNMGALRNRQQVSGIDQVSLVMIAS